MTSPDDEQKAARLRDLYRLRDLISPHVPDGSAAIAEALARMPGEDAAEARALLARIGAIGEDPAVTAARRETLLDLARLEDVIRGILSRPHYEIRGGRVVTDPETGEPVPDHAAERQARAQLAGLERLRGRLTGLPPADDQPRSAQ